MRSKSFYLTDPRRYNIVFNQNIFFNTYCQPGAVFDNGHPLSFCSGFDRAGSAYFETAKSSLKGLISQDSKTRHFRNRFSELQNHI